MSELRITEMTSANSDRRLSALIEAGIALVSEFDIDVLLHKIADLAREVIGARYGAVGVVGEPVELVQFVQSGIDESTVRLIGHLPTGEGVLGAVIEQHKPLRLKKISDHPRSVGFPAHHPEMHTFLGFPIVVRKKVWGRLYLTEKVDGSFFTEDDERTGLLFAAQAGVALENAHLSYRMQDMAVLEERDRISKDLHDGVIQAIYSVGLSIQSSIPLFERDPEKARQRLDEAISELDNVVRDVRSYIFELQPKSVEERGLVPAIRELVRDLEVNTLVETTVDLDEDLCESLSNEQRIHMIQVIREILANIARHAEAHVVSVSCEERDGELVLIVVDDGLGFDANAVRRGQGLRNIEDRAAKLEGRIEMEPRSPKGSRTTLTMPSPRKTGG